MKIRTALVTAVLATTALFAGASPAAAAPEPAALAGIDLYRVTFATGDLSNADTDDAVRFTIVGDQASSGPTRIERDFRRGEVVTFGPYSWVSLGTVTQIIVTKSNQEEDAWYLDHVQVQEQSTGKIFICEADVWFPQTGPKRTFACALAA